MGPFLKKAGHKGGRGGVNAPRRPGKQVADVEDSGVRLDDEGGFHMGDGGAVPLGDEGGNVGENLTHVHENQAARINSDTRVVPTLRDEYLSWNLLPSDDSEYNANDAVANHSSPPHEQADIYETPPLSYPTIFLLNQSPPRAVKQTLQQQHLEGQPAQHQPAHQHPAQQLQQNPPLVQQQLVPEPLHMQLQERNRHTRCGTTGREIPDCKWLRY